MTIKKFSILISCMMLASQVHAQQLTDSTTWKYVDYTGTSTRATTDNAKNGFDKDTGTPKILTNIMDRLDETVLDEFYGLVPSGLQVDPTLFDNTFNNISVKEDYDGVVTVKVAFLNEGAGYRNSLGYFIYDTLNPPTQQTIDVDVEHVIIFPNASAVGSSGGLLQGDQVDLKIELLAGQSIGFFIASNNWNGRWGEQKTNLQFGQPFYTLPELNPIVGLGDKYHVVFDDNDSTSISSEEDGGFFVFGFEDIRTDMGDKDFNDLIFNVEVSPLDAIDNMKKAKKLKKIADTEITKQGKLAFEDNWPQKGDYDFNDAVISYDLSKVITTQENSSGNDVEVIKSLSVAYEIEAIGAIFRNGIALSLPDISLANVDTLSLTKFNADGQQIAQYDYANGEFSQNDIAVSGFAAYEYPLAVDSENPRLVITLTENLFEELSVFDANADLSNSTVCMFRTSQDSGIACDSSATANTWQLDVAFKLDESAEDNWVDADTTLQAINYDHFMFSSEKGNMEQDLSLYRFARDNSDNNWFTLWSRGFNQYGLLNGPGRYLEIHLSNYTGTQWFEMEGSYRDPSEFLVDVGAYSVDADFQNAFVVKDQNLPWALDLPATWQHTLENKDISLAYPLFINWLENPNQNTDWYKTNINEAFIYSAQ